MNLKNSIEKSTEPAHIKKLVPFAMISPKISRSPAYDSSVSLTRCFLISNFTRFRKRTIYTLSNYALSKDVQYALTATLSSDSMQEKKRGPCNKIHD